MNQLFFEQKGSIAWRSNSGWKSGDLEIFVSFATMENNLLVFFFFLVFLGEHFLYLNISHCKIKRLLRELFTVLLVFDLSLVYY